MPDAKYHHIMNCLMKDFNLDSDQQAKYRRLIRALEEESFASGRECEFKNRPEPPKYYKSRDSDISDKQDLFDQQERDWYRQQRNK